MKILRTIVSVFAVLLLLFGCNASNEANKNKDSLSTDSIEEIEEVDDGYIKVGYLPTLDALPLLVAQNEGYFDSLNVKVKLIRYEAGLDQDTAFAKKRINGMVTDLCRAIILNSKNSSVKVISKTDGVWYLVTARKQRLRKVQDMEERMIAIAREEASDYLLDRILEKGQVDLDIVNRPQINNLPLRQHMISSEEIDAGIIPEPWATKAVVNGDRLIANNKELNLQPGCIVFNQRTIVEKEAEIKIIAKAYNLAIQQINEQPTKYNKLMQESYGIDELVTDTLTLPHYKKLEQPKQADIDDAIKWLKNKYPEQDWLQTRILKNEYNGKQLIDTRFIK